MKIRIEVKDRAEGDAIQLALGDPETRAFVVIVGTLLPFSDRAKRRILEFVADSATDPETPVRFRIERAGEHRNSVTGAIPLASGE